MLEWREEEKKCIAKTRKSSKTSSEIWKGLELQTFSTWRRHLSCCELPMKLRDCPVPYLPALNYSVYVALTKLVPCRLTAPSSQA